MIAILSKPPDQITAADVTSLVTSRVPEGDRIEYKKELPAAKGKREPWMSGQQKIGDHAKNQILKEVVSFANAYGGLVVLGMEEDTNSTPAVAKGICPIPKCAELAERFRLIFRDRVEPQLRSCDIFPVVTGGAGDGVVVFRVSGSRLAPHRITGTWICPVRRWDRSEEMSMREIQDMTINVTRGLEALDKRLNERAARFEREFDRLTIPDNAYGIRITAMPVNGDIRLPKVCGPSLTLVEGLNSPRVTVTRQRPEQEPTLVPGLSNRHRVGHLGWNPQLRAARSRPISDPRTRTDDAYLELHCDGLVEFGWLEVIEGGKYEALCSDYAVRELANVICWADTVRCYADVGRAEYVLAVAVHVTADEVLVWPGSMPSEGLSHRSSHFTGQLSRGVTPMPRYSLDDVSDAGALLSVFEHDLCNAGGHAFADDVLGRFEIQCDQG